MRFTFRGGAMQVGRSCVEVETQGDRYLIDCGIRFLDNGFEYPQGILGVKEIDGVLISHAHLDHTGALPFFEHLNLLCPIFMTSQTKAIAKILLKDSYKIARIKHIHPAYNSCDLKKIDAQIRQITMEKPYHFRKLDFTFYNAGHIPGSSSILFEAEGKRCVYTGDMNTRDSNLMKGTDASVYKDIDVLITETTYGARPLPERKKLGEDFLDMVEATIKKGGRVLIPSFAVGRAQDVLITLSKRKWDVPVYFDGMCKQVTRKILTNPSSYVRNKDALHDMYFNRVTFVASENMRNEIAQKPGIFVCTSGMLQGGPAIHYLKHFWNDENSAVLLTGYQVKNTNGWLLREKGEVYIKGWRTEVKCHIQTFEFSAHLDQKDLQDYIQTVNPKTLILMHGNEEAITTLGAWAKKNTKAKVYTPKVDDVIEV